jgi:hypothetical protein
MKINVKIVLTSSRLGWYSAAIQELDDKTHDTVVNGKVGPVRN